MKLTAKNLYFALLGACVLAFGALLAGAYGADSLLKQKSNDVRNERLNSLVLEQQQQQLAKAKESIASHQAMADIAKLIVPQDKDQAQTVREIVNIAGQFGIQLGSITFPSSSLGDKKGDALSQLTQVKDIPGVYSLDIVVTSDNTQAVKYSDFLAFLDALEHNRRTALVESISLQPNSQDANRLTFNLKLREYIKP